MKLDLVTFDCAQTLIKVDWEPGRFAVACAEACGVDVGAHAADLYRSLIHQRQLEYLSLNLSRDHARCEVFWEQLTRDWLSEQRIDVDSSYPAIKSESDRRGFSRESEVFQVYEDVLPTLEWLKSQGIRVAIISNWDYSLHKVLEATDLSNRFDTVVASLEHGFEKPDPRIFSLVLDQFGVEPKKALHIGDDPIDDLQGARNVGMHAFLLDRKLKASSRPYLSSLNDLPGAFDWID